MLNLTHLFKVGEKVKIKIEEFGVPLRWENGTVKEVHENYIIVNKDKYDVNAYFEEGINLDAVYPIYNFLSI